MSSKTRSEIEAVTKLSRDSGESDQSYFKRLATGVQKLGDPEFDGLSAVAQDWFNAACDAADAKQDLPVFKDEVAEEAPRRRRATAEEPKEEPAKYVPTKGDKVRVTNKRGKTLEGTFVEMDEGEYVIDDGKEEVVFGHADSSTIEPLDPPKEESSSRRRRAEPEPEPEGPAEPEVGDTLEITNQRGKVYVGILKEETDDEFVLETLSGDVEDISKERVKSLVIKHRASAAKTADTKAKDEPAAGTSRRRGAATAETEPAAGGREKKVTNADNGGVSVTQRTSELVIENRKATVEQIAAMLKKEGLAFKDVTMELNFKQTHKFLKMLDDRGMLK